MIIHKTTRTIYFKTLYLLRNENYKAKENIICWTLFIKLDQYIFEVTKYIKNNVTLFYDKLNYAECFYDYNWVFSSNI